MKKCILHIGMHKTGSSTIQAYLHRYRSELGGGVVYGDLGNENHSGCFQYAFMRDDRRVKRFVRRGCSVSEVNQRSVKSLSKIIKALESDFNTIIFSGEGIVNLNNEELIELRNVFLKYVDEIVVVAYIRPVVSYMASAFQQQVKSKKIYISTSLAPKYKQRFSKFEEVFKNNVEYCLFKKEYLIDGDIVADFCNRFHLPLYDFEIKNVSLKSLAIKFIYRVQMLRLSKAAIKGEVVLVEDALKNIGKGSFKIPESIVEEALLEVSEDIDWMELRLGVSGVLGDRVEVNEFKEGEALFKVSSEEKIELLTLSDNDKFSGYVFELTGKTIAEIVDLYF